MEQVYAAKRLRASLVVDKDHLARHEEAAASAASEAMAKRLVDMGHPLGIELHRDDFEVIWEDDQSTPWQATGRMRWNPTTNTAELRGGHLDGQRYAIQRIGDPLRIVRPVASPWLDISEDASQATLTELTDTYELVGWREDSRVWVYAVRA